MTRITSLVVACPSFAALEPETEIALYHALLPQMAAQGVRVSVVRSVGDSDIAHHRARIARQVVDVLEAHPTVEAVLWHDGDNILSCEGLCELLLVLGVLRKSLGGGERTPALSGAYVRRSRREALAVTGLAGRGEIELVLEAANGSQRLSRLLPVLAPLGCLLLTRELFFEAWRRAPHFLEKGRELHTIGEAGRKEWTGEPSWFGEDYSYSMQLWEGPGVYLVQEVRVGHVLREVVSPRTETVLETLALEVKPEAWGPDL